MGMFVDYDYCFVFHWFALRFLRTIVCFSFEITYVAFSRQHYSFDGLKLLPIR